LASVKIKPATQPKKRTGDGVNRSEDKRETMGQSEREKWGERKP